MATVAPPKRKSRLGGVLAIVALFIGLGVVLQFFQGAAAPTRALTAEHLAAVEQVHAKNAWLRPKSVEIASAGFVVATYEIRPDTAIPARTIGTTRLLAIREALLPFGFKDYRVNVNGPPPGTGLVQRYGSARFIDAGGKVEWLTP